MARKNLLTSITATLAGENSPSEPSGDRAAYAKRGASRSMIQSLDDLAENTMRMLDGDTVVALDPINLDDSFVADRIGDDEEEYRSLKEAIRQTGQSSPILVRPHPGVEGRYMIVFGHRRARVARDLGLKVRAVVKQVADIEHVIAQGQENAARADLTFIEKALFARRLLASGMSKDVIKTALTIDDSLLSRMLSVAEIVPKDILNALGAAKRVGRDRWEELKKAVLNPAAAKLAIEIVGGEEFAASPEENRFQFLLNSLVKTSKVPKPKKMAEQPKPWAPADNLVSVSVKKAGKTAIVTLGAKDGVGFADYITGRLEILYEDFRKSQKASAGD